MKTAGTKFVYRPDDLCGILITISKYYMSRANYDENVNKVCKDAERLLSRLNFTSH